MSLPKWVETTQECCGVSCEYCVRVHVQALTIAVEALEKMQSVKFHIGNDAHGNMFGPPDSVMCRNIAKEALRRIEEMGK